MQRIKHITAALVSIALFSVLFSSCHAENNQVSAFILNNSEDEEATSLESTKLYENLVYQYKEDENASKIAAVTVNGVTYEGEYYLTSVVPTAMYLKDWYQTKDGSVQFSLERDTGNLGEYLYHITENEPNPIFSVEECRDIAEDFVRNYFNLSEYVLVEIKESDRLCGFIYKKYLNEMETEENFIVSVRKSQGHIATFSTQMTGRFPNKLAKSTVNSIDSLKKRAPKVIKEKIASEFPDCKRYEIDSERLCLLPDGSYGMKYKIKTFYETKKAVEIYGNSFDMVVKFD